MRIFRHPLRFLREQRDGVTAIEFALVAPVLLLLIMGTIEFSLIMFVQSVMESATYNASRLGKTGYSYSGESRAQSIIQMVDQRTAGLLDPTKISISETSYSNWGLVGVQGNGANNNAGNAGDVVVYVVTYPWPVFTPIMQQFLGQNGIFTITARAVVQNEPY